MWGLALSNFYTEVVKMFRSRLAGAAMWLEGWVKRAVPRRLWDDSGQSQVEFALTCTFLLPILFGITAFGIAMNNYMSLTEATGVGARQLSLERGQGGDPCAIAAATIAAAAPLLNNSGSAATGIGYTFLVNSVSYGATCSNATLTQGAPVTVTTTYPCVLKIYGHNYAPSCVLTAQTAEVLQ
jgi:Flp pilus assembly protein TadG